MTTNESDRAQARSLEPLAPAAIMAEHARHRPGCLDGRESDGRHCLPYRQADVIGALRSMLADCGVKRANLSAENAALRERHEEALNRWVIATRQNDALREKLAGPCGSCHPCTEWANQTWINEGLSLPSVIKWQDMKAERDALLAAERRVREIRWHHLGDGDYAAGMEEARRQILAALDGAE